MRLAVATLLVCGTLAAGEFPIGSKLDAISVTDHGAPVTVKPSSAKATAVIFISTNCPVSNAYNERFNELYRDYSAKGLQFAFVNANQNEPASDVDRHAKASGFTFKVLKDEASEVADRLNAQYTPEVFLFDNAGTLVYHGRIDDSRELSGVKKKDARAAFDAVLSGQAVPVVETKAFGCSIKRAKRTS